MNRVDTSRRAQVIQCLIEGNSINSTVRMTGVAKNTVLKLLVDLGEACSAYQDRKLRHLHCQRIQVDECWAFCYAKAKNVTKEITEKNPFAGDVWTWAAIDADTKLIPSWLIGPRDGVSARIFISDLRHRVYGRFQISSDGFPAYAAAIERSFEGHIDYAQIVKIFGSPVDGEKRYSPAECIGCEKKVVTGYPDPKHISTSYIERANLTLRMGIRRFTRLTNAFSKKIENHTASVALYMMYYNFGRKHTTLGTTPAVAAGVTDHIWSIEEIVGLLEATEPKATRPTRAVSSN
jgi:IS1 family transposase